MEICVLLFITLIHTYKAEIQIGEYANEKSSRKKIFHKILFTYNDTQKYLEGYVL